MTASGEMVGGPRAPRGGLSIRASFGLLMAAGAASIGLLAVYLAVSTIPPAAAVRRSTVPVVYLIDALSADADALGAAVQGLHHVVAAHGVPAPAIVMRERKTIAALTSPVRLGGYAEAPAPIRSELAAADADVTRLQNRLFEVLDLIQIRSRDAAVQRLLVADSLETTIRKRLSTAGARGVRDLLTREATLERAGTRAMWTAGLLALVAAGFAGASLTLFRRRLGRPLADLETALDRVRGGDLSTPLLVRRPDEMGRLARHFNAMTHVMAAAHRQDEEALRRSERQFQAVMENIPDSIYFKDVESRFVSIGRAMARRFGLSDPAQAVGKTDFDFFTRDHAQAALETEQQVIRTGHPVVDMEEMETWPDRPNTWVSTTKMPLRDSGGAVVGTFGVSRDITRRKRAEELLRRSETDYRGLVDHAPLGVYRSTRSGRLLTVNAALVSMLGYDSAAQLLSLDMGRDVYADPQDRARLIREDPPQVEVEWKRRDGTRILVQLNSRAIPGPAGEGTCYEGMVQDITQQRSLENQFRQAQRLEAVGRLAGGVAHDFNNILTAITGYSDLLFEDLHPDDPKRGDVQEIKAAAQRATALTRQLLAFSRKQILQTRVLDLNEVVRTLEKMLHRLIGEDVKLETSLSPGLGAVRADPGQLEQVILNLAVNSRDAMPGGGWLTIETANVELDEVYARDHAGATPGRYVMLAVSDTGVGMDAETQSHIFEPFFTTKEKSKGTGLGLATVYGIVKQSGGYVWVYSERGRGTTFKIYLRQVDEPVEGEVPAGPTRPSAGGRETVLVAEDDASVREVTAQILAQRGYFVLRAPDGQTALEMARAHPSDIPLLITDVVMPGLTGPELAAALAAERSGIRVIYMSGYASDAVVRHRILEQGMPYLQKPFTPEALASKVREVLDRH